MHNDAPDYDELLTKYMAHIKLCTGKSHLYSLSKIEFTEDEMHYLREFANEADEEIESLT